MALIGGLLHREHVVQAALLEFGDIRVPLGFDIAIAEDPGLLALQHVVPDRAPILVVDFLLFDCERDTQELVDQIVAVILECDGFERVFVRPLLFMFVVLKVAMRLKLGAGLPELAVDRLAVVHGVVQPFGAESREATAFFREPEVGTLDGFDRMLIAVADGPAVGLDRDAAMLLDALTGDRRRRCEGFEQEPVDLVLQRNVLAAGRSEPVMGHAAQAFGEQILARRISPGEDLGIDRAPSISFRQILNPLTIAFAGIGMLQLALVDIEVMIGIAAR